MLASVEIHAEEFLKRIYSLLKGEPRGFKIFPYFWTFAYNFLYIFPLAFKKETLYNKDTRFSRLFCLA